MSHSLIGIAFELWISCVCLIYILYNLKYQLKEMCCSSHTDFFSKDLLTTNHPNEKNHKKVSQNEEKPG